MSIDAVTPQLLWNEMMKLKVYVDDENEDMNNNIRNIFEKENKEVPGWLNEAIVFSPLIKCFDDDIDRQLLRISELQKKLQEKISENEDYYTIKSSVGDENTLESLKEEVRALEMQMKQLGRSDYTLSSFSRGPYSQTMSSMEDQIGTAMAIYRKLQNEIAQMQELEKTCIENLDEYTNEHKTLLENLNQTTEDTKKYRSSLNEIDSFIKQIKKHKNLLIQRKTQLVQMISKLESTKIESAKQIAKLNDELSEHTQLVESYHSIEDKIKEQEMKQEDSLEKMISAVELSENANAAMQKAKMARDINSDELERIRFVVSSTENKFNESVALQESQIKMRYESALNKLNSRIKIVESDNQQLEETKDGMLKQKNASTQENSVLKATKSDNGFSSFIEEISSLKAEIETSFTKKGHILLEIEQSKQVCDSLKEKESQTRSNAKSEHSLLLQKKQHLEMELEMQKDVLKEVLSKNAKLKTENTKIQSQLSQLERVNDDTISDELKNKRNAISELNIQLDELNRGNDKAISDVEKTILSYKQNAEKWKIKANSISIDAKAENESLESDISSLQDRIESLLSVIVAKKQDSARLKVAIEESEQELNHLKDTQQILEKKQRRNQYEISQRTEVQLEFSRLKHKYADYIDRVDLKIKQKEREINALKNKESFLSDTDSAF